MEQRKGTSGPQFRADRPAEQEAVRTTIVGGRPPGSGQSTGNMPRGIEVLIKKAAVDPAFKELLLAKRAEAADAIGLKLDPAEAIMLAAAPAEQLEAVIARTSVPAEHRRAFLGQAAAAMLATIGLATAGCPVAPAGVRARPKEPTPTKGIRPDAPDEERQREQDEREREEKDRNRDLSEGARPDLPRPEQPEGMGMSLGTRPKPEEPDAGVEPRRDGSQ